MFPVVYGYCMDLPHEGFRIWFCCWKVDMKVIRLMNLQQNTSFSASWKAAGLFGLFPTPQIHGLKHIWPRLAWGVVCVARPSWVPAFDVSIVPATVCAACQGALRWKVGVGFFLFWVNFEMYSNTKIQGLAICVLKKHVYFEGRGTLTCNHARSLLIQHWRGLRLRFFETHTYTDEYFDVV
jgi:hypothetical protein